MTDIFEKTIQGWDEFFLESDDRALYRFVISKIEKPLIEKTLQKTGGNKLQAAKLLGINRNTLYYKIKKLGIEVDRWKDH